MATRSVIARKTEDGHWEGRYHHWDGYPSGVGWALWHIAHEQYGGDLHAMMERLIDSDDAQCGWSNIVGCDLRLEAVSPEEAVYEDPYPPIAYAKRGYEKPSELITPRADLSGLWYVYIVDPNARTMEICHVAWETGNVLPGDVISFDGPEPDWKNRLMVPCTRAGTHPSGPRGRAKRHVHNSQPITIVTTHEENHELVG